MTKLSVGLDKKKITSRIERIMGDIRPIDWARKIGVSKNVVSNIHGDTEQPPSLEYIVAVSIGTGVSMDYLLWGHELSPAPEIPPGAVRVPLVDGHIAAGPGRIVPSVIKEYFHIPAPELAKKQQLIAVRIGNRETSMMPTLGPGSVVVIDQEDNIEIRNKHIYAVRLPDDHCSIKRLIVDKDTKRVILLSDNRHHPPRIALKQDHLIIGRVVWACQGFDITNKVSACDV